MIEKLFKYSSGLGGIERLSHHDEGLRRGRGRRQAHLPHQLGGVGRQKHLFGDPLVIDLALDLPPPLHLGEHPDREGLPWEWIEIDAFFVLTDAAEAIGIGAGERLLTTIGGWFR